MYSTLILVIVALMVMQSVSAQSNIFYNQTFTVSAPSGDSCYYNAPASITNATGFTVEGSITVSSGKVDFYILNSAEAQQFLSGSRKGACGNIRPLVSELKVIGITSYYAVNYLVPDNGNHYFLFFNPYSSDAAVSLVLGWAASTTTSQPVTSYNYPTTSYSSVASQPSLSQGQNSFTFNNYVAYLVVLVAAGAVVVFMIWNHGRPRRTSRPSLLADYIASKPTPKTTVPRKAETAPKKEKSQPEKAFCINCGKELPPDWKFCRHCGTKQP